MQLRLPWSVPLVGREGRQRVIEVEGRAFPLDIARHRWARRYVLRVMSDGRLRLTVPRGASISAGVTFATGQAAWIAAEWRRQQTRTAWGDGTTIWLRGERTTLAVVPGGIRCGALVLPLRPDCDVRETVQVGLRDMAAEELPERCFRLGESHGLRPARVSVRDQRTRWGACSARKAITLNWRLVQMPPDVADYVLLHELAHIAHPNHSVRFWRKVAAICPAWRDAERWLRKHGRELL